MSSRYSPLPLVLAFLAGSFVIACDTTTDPGDQLPDRIEITAAADTLTALGDQTQLTARAFDADGNEILGLEFDWSCVNCGVASVVPTTGSVTAVSNGSAVVRASIPGLDVTPGEIAIHVSQRAATVTVSPASPTLNTVGATQTFTATALDSNDNPIEDFVTLWISGDHRVATVSPTGVATSTGAGAATITAAVHGIPGNATLTVDQDAAELAFIRQPANTTAGSSISPAIQIEVQDAAGNRVADADLDITLTIASGPGNLGGSHTVGAVNGVATFSGMWIDLVGAYTLEASAAGTVAATSSGFNIAAGAPAQLSFTTQPVNADGNQPMAVGVTITDDWGNVVPGATNAVTLRFDNNPGEAELLGTTTVAATAGVAGFTIRIDRPAEGYALQARADGLDPAISTDFTVSLNFSKLAPGLGSHSCGIVTGGHAYCWGYNWAGQLGNGSTDASALPVLVAGGHEFTEINAGEAHTCAITSDGAAYCWGYNWAGQLGNNNNQSTNIPAAVQGGHQFRAITTGYAHTCAITTSDDGMCWGYNGNGQLGTNDVASKLVPTSIAGSQTVFASMAAGYYHTCGIAAGNLYCWGRDSEGQVGNGATTGNILVPSNVTPTDVQFKTVTSGYYHSCGTTIETDGDRARCWGYNAYGQIGNNSTTTVTAPTLTQVANAGDDNYLGIEAGGWHTCAFRPNNSTYCWGRNSEGQLGIGEFGANRTTREPISGGLGFAALALGASHSCGIAPNGDTYCWGLGSNGQLGTGQFVNVNTPARIRQ